MSAKIQQIHKDHSPLVFLYFDASYKQVQLSEGEQLREVEFDGRCYAEIMKAFDQKSITPRVIIFRFVPGQGVLFLPQSIDLTNECKDEIEIRSMPLLLYDEMLPMV